jgi:hypothetical protein
MIAGSGCTCSMDGRRGWGKLLKDYRVTRLLLEKTLA